MVLTARASALLDRFAKHLPALTDVFLEAIERGVDGSTPFLQTKYAELPSADFSRDLIAASGGLSFHTWPVDMGWSDLGTPDRLASWQVERRRDSSVRHTRSNLLEQAELHAV